VEPFGLAFIEALYAGFPCIATRGSGGPEMIIDQNSGVVVPSNDADVPAAEAALCDPARQINQLSEALHQVVSQSRKCSVARLLLE
jgi:glycosyltransferase involved in cell wall biosynthesis